MGPIESRGRPPPLPHGLACLVLLLCSAVGSGGRAEGDQAASGRMSGPRSILYGPVLDARIVTPARYLYVQAVDEQGRNFTSSPGSGIKATVTYKRADGQLMKLNSQVHDRGDGTFQVFFTFFSLMERLTISVRTEDTNELVGGRRVEHDWPEFENCYCPAGDGEDFAAHYGCPAGEKQLEADLEPFPVLTRDLVGRARQALLDKESCFVHYVVRKNKVWGKAYGKYQGFKQYVDEMLLSLARRVHLPDAEFVFNLGDWPQANLTAKGLPVVSWCGSNETDDIVVPTYKATLSTVFGKDLENVKDVDAKCHKVGGGWDNKVPKLFWRGRDSNALRTRFVDEVAAKNPKYIDAHISKNHFNYYPSETDRKNDKRLQAGLKVDRTGFESYWRFRYLLNIDGTVAAYRLPALLAGDSVVLKHDSKWYEHFYAELEPWVHYIPVKEDLSDVLQQLQWARNHDKKSRAIARNGREFARRRLGAEGIYCYWYRTLQQYSARMDYVPEMPEGYEQLQQPKAECRCADKPKRKKKDREGKKSKKRKGGGEEGGGGVGAGGLGGNAGAEGTEAAPAPLDGVDGVQHEHEPVHDWGSWDRPGLSAEL